MFGGVAAAAKIYATGSTGPIAVSGANIPSGLPANQAASGAHHPSATPQPLASTTALALSSESLQNPGPMSSKTPAPGQVVKVPVAG